MISRVNFNEGKKENYLSFTSCAKIYNPKMISKLDIFSGKNVRTTSSLLRGDIDWDFMMKYIFLNFYDKNKINIYSLACSDGSEPVTYALYLKSKVPDSYSKKVQKILACDIDPEMIRIAKSGKINLYPEDLRNLKKYLKKSFEYFEPIEEPIKIKNNFLTPENGYKIKSDITKMIKFKKSDILTEVKAIEDDGNSVVNIRNVFPYLKKEYINEVLITLSDKLKTGSIFVFGDYEQKIPFFRHRLHKLGFFSPVSHENFVQKL